MHSAQHGKNVPELNPSRFNKFLREKDLVNEIYEAMESDDYSDVVMAVINSLKKGKILTQILTRQKIKCEKMSDKFRSDGNVAFRGGNLVSSMHLYNKALMYAPDKSKAMLLAFSNRSAVLFTIEHFAECLVDIETCFQLGCPTDIFDKLNKRKESAIAKMGNLNPLADMRVFCKNVLQIENRNAEVPCASADVNIVLKDGVAKITAAKNINVGTILACESPFVGCNDSSNRIKACRHCFCVSGNLIPCDSCCFVMFCSEKCKRKCQQEYHNVECQIMEVIKAMGFSYKTVLMVAGALKFVRMCETWKKAIVESKCIGSKRRHVSNISQMFDATSKLSILNYEEDNIFVHGNMYERSFECAFIINKLDTLPSYFPETSSERAQAKRALARVMMFIALYAKPSKVVFMLQPQSSSLLFRDFYDLVANNALYPFIGKLQNSCTPNVIVANARVQAVLVALQPIKKGSELTISHMGHYLDSVYSSPHQKNVQSLLMFGRVCKCFICSNEWRTRCDSCVLTEKQLAAYRKQLISHKTTVSPTTLSIDFPLICDTLACLSSAPFSKEYIDVYIKFRTCLALLNFHKDA